ncbi:class I SAM-dependent methyltransferase [Gaiella sp.]|uniref:class I SAM-dependent methyltransferase n=1 Tax=Gaiella sp. TaxID=2663207 RepID=UPI003983B99F
MADEETDQLEGWRSVAAGWERRRDLFARATAELSERMIELLDPHPGDRVLEVAAGPGETGFRVLARIRPGGELISTDGAPEMVEAARRRASELGLTGVRFRVEDAAALSLPDNDVDCVLCRFGIMLVPDMEAAASEIARVLRPGGAAVLAVWAGTSVNPWMTAPGKAATELGHMGQPDHDAPGPFRLSDPERLRAVVASGGLAIETIEDVPVRWVAGSLDEWWETTRDTSRMLTQLTDRLTPGDIAELRMRAELNLAEFVQGDGSVEAPGVARIVLARGV